MTYERRFSNNSVSQGGMIAETPKNIELERANMWTQAIQRFSSICEYPLTAQQIETVARGTSHRYEAQWALDNRRRSSTALFSIVRKIYRPDAIPRNHSAFHVSRWTKAQKQDLASYLLRSTQGVEFTQGFPTIEIPVESLTLKIQPGLAQGEGLTGLYFSLKDEKASEYTGFYVVRGNLITAVAGNEFHIQTIQPWADESAITISKLTRDEQLRKQNPELANAIREKNRLTQRFSRRTGIKSNARSTVNNNGSEIAGDDRTLLQQLEFDRAEFVLLTTITYLQALGIKIFKGIDQNKHYELFYHNGNLSYSLDYNELFSKWFEQYDDIIHPWILDANNSYFYLPHWNAFNPPMNHRLTPFTRSVICGVFSATQKNT